jgi:hypothetical protein
MKVIKQVPAEGFDWLTKLETADEKDRKFGKVVYRPESEPAWDDWTQEQWQEWQDEYNPQPEPPELENE